MKKNVRDRFKNWIGKVADELKDVGETVQDGFKNAGEAVGDGFIKDAGRKNGGKRVEERFFEGNHSREISLKTTLEHVARNSLFDLRSW